MRRRRFIATGAGVSVGLLAGCSGSSDSSGSDGTSGDGTSDGGSTDEDAMTDDGGTVGTFQLLISDQPAAIGDFDSLDVSFSEARIFHAEGGEETEESADATDTESTETATAEATETETIEPTETETAEPTETADDDDADDEDEDGEDMDAEADEGAGSFEVRDLDGATVDLTEVVGDKAIGVLDGELEAGRYSKVELYAESVDGVVDGESVDVKIPSEKLQLTKPFEVVAGEAIEFVFDINVIKKGNGGYNLLPVISKSGVAGKDVDVEEVGEGTDTDDQSDETDDEETETTDFEETDRDSMTESDQRGNETTAAE